MCRVVLVVLGIVACGKDPEPLPAAQAHAQGSAEPRPRPPKPAPRGTWSSMDYFKLTGADELKFDSSVGVSVLRGNLVINPQKLPEHTVLEVGDARFELGVTKADPGRNFLLSIERQIADLPWASLQRVKRAKYTVPQKVDLKLPLVVTLPGREPVRTTLPPLDVTNQLEEIFVAMATGDHAWPDDNPPAAPPRAAAWTHGFDALGTADKVRDVRFVAVTTHENRSDTRTCGGYIGGADVKAGAYDVTITIVDRISKAELAKKKFSGRATCPETVTYVRGKTPSVFSGPDAKAMRAWVLAQVRRLAK